MNINAISDYVVRKLSGWSYNKGEPLLIYEYMTNGSLDQHLFRRGSTRQQQEDDASLWQWHTRYSIARDIATGLHYVHHEHEPMVLHRDIKASNIMLDSAFRARLGDFGIACTVAVNRSSVTGVAGTFGYIGPDYAMRHKATRQTDIYAFGVLILEIVTGKKNGDVVPDDDHITDWVWRLHREGKLLEAAHGVLTVEEDYHQLGLDDDVVDEAKRLLLLGLACTNPNPSDRPSMVEVVQVLTKSAPAPDVPLERPPFVWLPMDWRSRNSVYSTAASCWDGSSVTDSTVELGQIIGQESGMEETPSSMPPRRVSAN
jgi:interleukin-1 receptor-associated kinase 1